MVGQEGNRLYLWEFGTNTQGGRGECYEGTGRLANYRMRGRGRRSIDPGPEGAAADSSSGERIT